MPKPLTGHKIGFAGLGNMGSAIGERLLEAGYSLTVWNRSVAKTAALTDRGATLSARRAFTRLTFRPYLQASYVCDRYGFTHATKAKCVAMPMWLLHILALLNGCCLLLVVSGRSPFNAELLTNTNKPESD